MNLPFPFAASAATAVAAACFGAGVGVAAAALRLPRRSASARFGAADCSARGLGGCGAAAVLGAADGSAMGLGGCGAAAAARSAWGAPPRATGFGAGVIDATFAAFAGLALGAISVLGNVSWARAEARHRPRRVRAIERREGILQLGRGRLAARLDALADHHAQHEQHAGDDGAAEEQEEHLAVVQAHLDLVAPPLGVSIDVPEGGLFHAFDRSVSHRHESSSFVTAGSSAFGSVARAIASGAETPSSASALRVTWAMASTQ